MLFADDMVILSNSPSDLQNSLNLLQTYCNKWGLEVNPEKSKIVVFRKRGGVKHDEKWTYNDVPLEVVNSFNYLGTVLNYNGNFVLNQETLAGKGLKALNAFLVNTRNMMLKPSTMCHLFHSLDSSVLSYACEIWGFVKVKKIERVLLKFCKMLLPLKQSTGNMAIYGDLNRFPLYIDLHLL